jgi:hypothetical protein
MSDLITLGSVVGDEPLGFALSHSPNRGANLLGSPPFVYWPNGQEREPRLASGYCYFFGFSFGKTWSSFLAGGPLNETIKSIAKGSTKTRKSKS